MADRDGFAESHAASSRRHQRSVSAMTASPDRRHVTRHVSEPGQSRAAKQKREPQKSRQRKTSRDSIGLLYSSLTVQSHRKDDTCLTSEVSHKKITESASLPPESSGEHQDKHSFRRLPQSVEDKRRTSRKTSRRQKGRNDYKRTNSNPELGARAARRRSSSRRISCDSQGLLYRQLSHRKCSYHETELECSINSRHSVRISSGSQTGSVQQDGDPEEPGSTEDATGLATPSNVDGGWAWVVMVASTIIIIVSDGLAFSFGVLLPELKKHFVGKEEEVALVGSVMGGVHLMAGPLASVLCEVMGYRAVALMGSILSTLAILAGSFSPNVEVLIITYGALGGLGFSLMYVSAMVITSLYFEKKRPIAVGIASCGSGIGMVLFPLFIEKLLDVTTWNNVLRSAALLVLAAGLAAIAFKPLEHLQEAGRTSCKDKVCRLLDFSLFKNPAFILISFMAICSTIGIGIPVIFLPDMAIHRGVDDDSAAMLVSVVGVTNTLFRVGVGALVYFSPLNPVLLLAGASVTGATLLFLNPFYTTFPTLATFAGLFGMTFAFDAALATVIIVYAVGASSLSGVFGLHCLFRGVTHTICGPIAASLMKSTGTYDASFYLAGGAIVCNGVLCLVLYLYTRLRGEPDDSIQEDEDHESPGKENMAAIAEESDETPLESEISASRVNPSSGPDSLTSCGDPLVNQTV